MKSAIKYSIYVAAGIGIFEVLRRTGLMSKAGEWLQEQVPDDIKDKARDFGNQVQDQMHGAMDQVRDKAGQLRDKAGHFMSKAQDTASDLADRGKEVAGKVSDNLQNGVSEMTSDASGASIPQQVGRGIVH